MIVLKATQQQMCSPCVSAHAVLRGQVCSNRDDRTQDLGVASELVETNLAKYKRKSERHPQIFIGYFF